MALSISGSSPSFSSYQGGTVTSGTAVASTSGTSITFTGIPSWAKRITVMFKDVSTNGASLIQIQLGSGSVQTTGYSGAGFQNFSGSASNISNSTTGILVEGASGAAAVYQGAMTINSFGSNTWVGFGIFNRSDSTNACFGSGSVTLSGNLDRVVITTVNGTDAFDAGSINILYE